MKAERKERFVTRRDTRDVSTSPGILIFMRLCQREERRRPALSDARESGCTCVTRAYARVRARARREDKASSAAADVALRSQRVRGGRGRGKLPSSSKCVTCVSDFYLPLTITILHSSCSSVCSFRCFSREREDLVTSEITLSLFPSANDLALSSPNFVSPYE